MQPFTILELAEAFQMATAPAISLIFIGAFTWVTMGLVEAWHHASEVREEAIKRKTPIWYKSIHIHREKK